MLQVDKRDSHNLARGFRVRLYAYALDSTGSVMVPLFHVVAAATCLHNNAYSTSCSVSCPVMQTLKPLSTKPRLSRLETLLHVVILVFLS